MLDRAAHTRLIAQPVPPLPVDALVQGKPVEEVAELLPRLFNLCRAAQRVAVRAVLGLPVTAKDMTAVTQEIRREHEVRLGVLLPLAFGLPAGKGPTSFPATPAEFNAFLQTDDPLAVLLQRIAQAFGGGQAVADDLAPASDRAVFSVCPQENSVAGRVSDDPVMQHVEAQHGRGPLWRVVARGVELRRLSEGWQPEIKYLADGIIAPAARGSYALQAIVAENRVETFHRITPTDHLLATGGILDASLGSLTDRFLASALMAILDPCSPVQLTEVPADA